MTNSSLTCILCPLSCQLELVVENNAVQSVTGNSCQQGLAYAPKEYASPTRMLTATVALQGGIVNRVPVRTREEIPKASIPACINTIRHLSVAAPVARGQIIAMDLAGTGVDLIASRSIEAI